MIGEVFGFRFFYVRCICFLEIWIDGFRGGLGDFEIDSFIFIRFIKIFIKLYVM